MHQAHCPVGAPEGPVTGALQGTACPALEAQFLRQPWEAWGCIGSRDEGAGEAESGAPPLPGGQTLGQGPAPCDPQSPARLLHRGVHTEGQAARAVNYS